MNRGELWTIAGGPDYAGKPRPALIVQDDVFDVTPSVTICLLTSEFIESPAVRIALEPNAANGLNAASQIMTDKITTVPRAKIGKRIGALTNVEMVLVDRAIMIFLGLGG
ncbi:MAG TPA: type II toxin-antitoxin system PemK/MazF family toxin [Novosphingobium sp.]|nr:type II toxin-antitoxin system PemK/MazF family toxin [Novosphingobium sp.]